MRTLFGIILIFVCGSNIHASEAVGKAALVIGTPKILISQESAQITVGSKIFSTSEIVTQSGDHVHIRFKDGTRVSLRPNSHLSIESYSANSGAVTEFRMTLKKGSARSISGKGLEGAKKNFRLNTPLAAIGIRGTDFTTKASPESTEVDVHFGEVVMAPFGESCSREALGPCNIAAAMSLVGGTDQKLRIRSEQSKVEVVPKFLVDAALRSRWKAEQEQEAMEQKVSQEGGESEKVLNQRVETTEDLLPYLAKPIPFDDTPDDFLRQKGDLVWGHWFSAPRGDDWSPSAFDLLQTMQPSVSNATYGLFRPTSMSGLNPIRSQVALKLQAADATYTAQAYTSLAKVQEGYLLLDFSNSSFLSHVNISSDRAGTIRLNGAGNISNSGIFVSQSSSDRMAGAISENGLEAGMLFEKRLNNGGIVQGISRWGQ